MLARGTCISLGVLAIATPSPSVATRRHCRQHVCRRHHADKTPPVFAGLTRVCYSSGVFSPLGPQLTFVWPAASDKVTPPGRIVYRIYGASSPGGEDFSMPLASSSPGTTSYTGRFPSPLRYFVVRARDQAGNLDANTVERQVGTNGCPPPPP